MAEKTPPSEDVNHALFIVVGAHLRAEEGDRPLGYQLQARIRAWLRRHKSALNVTLHPLICTDILYINNNGFHARPTISIGGPGVNALSAYFAQQLQNVDPQEQQIVIQIDQEYTDLRVCIWGTDHALTERGLELFVERYLEGFLRAVVTQVEPKEE